MQIKKQPETHKLRIVRSHKRSLRAVVKHFNGDLVKAQAFLGYPSIAELEHLMKNPGAHAYRVYN